MATTFSCDRCGLLSNSRSQIKQVELPTLSEFAFDEIRQHSMDLCTGCLRDLERWRKPLPKAMPPEPTPLVIPAPPFVVTQEPSAETIKDDDIPF